ncbi:hypothetical protein NDU88_002500 [Pleurodeles waltl]|uniref:Uncharacterized protein n=1 Tax=Pleurodeles waltl TaxID=8319 RepID=A0AAV7RDZ0_PLEWA|nr:hypothetical protein NDU88_002500 [Pleurodeles waltl]
MNREPRGTLRLKASVARKWFPCEPERVAESPGMTSAGMKHREVERDEGLSLGSHMNGNKKRTQINIESMDQKTIEHTVKTLC